MATNLSKTEDLEVPLEGVAKPEGLRTRRRRQQPDISADTSISITVFRQCNRTRHLKSEKEFLTDHPRSQHQDAVGHNCLISHQDVQTCEALSAFWALQNARFIFGIEVEKAVHGTERMLDNSHCSYCETR